jgi:HIRAN domain-containing protein
VSDLKQGRTTNTPAAARQHTTEACLELLAVYDTLAENGRLLPSEASALGDWLSVYSASAFLPQDQLANLVRRALGVGVITDSDRVAIRNGIDRLLPPDVREVVRTGRTKGSKRAHENLPVDGYRFIVAATREDVRATHIARYAFDGDEVLLVREAANPHSRSAVLVRLLTGFDIGYVPELDARSMAAHLDENLPYTASVKRIVRGGRAPIPIITADFYRTDSRIEGIRRPQDQFGSAALAYAVKTPSRGNLRPERDANYRALLVIALIALFAVLVLTYL